MPLQLITHHGTTDLPRDGDAKPRLVLLGREGLGHEVTAGRRTAAPINRVKLRRASQAPSSLRPALHADLGRQVLAPTGAAAADNRNSGARGHALTEAVNLGSLADIGLVGALHLRSGLRGTRSIPVEGALRQTTTAPIRPSRPILAKHQLFSPAGDNSGDNPVSRLFFPQTAEIRAGCRLSSPSRFLLRSRLPQ